MSTKSLIRLILQKDRTENALSPDERFFVIETDEGYAIWGRFDRSDLY